MDNNDRVVLVLVVLVVCTAACLSWVVYQTQVTERLKFERGYEQVTVPGVGMPVWQRADTVAVARPR